MCICVFSDVWQAMALVYTLLSALPPDAAILPADIQHQPSSAAKSSQELIKYVQQTINFIHNNINNKFDLTNESNDTEGIPAKLMKPRLEEVNPIAASVTDLARCVRAPIALYQAFKSRLSDLQLLVDKTYVSVMTNKYYRPGLH